MVRITRIYPYNFQGHVYMSPRDCHYGIMYPYDCPNIATCMGTRIGGLLCPNPHECLRDGYVHDLPDICRLRGNPFIIMK